MIFDIGDNNNTNYLSTTSYQTARTERLRIDNFTCQRCGNKRDLEVHHINRENNDAPNPQKDLITLCRTCHKLIEDTIKNKEFLTGQFWFTVVSANIEPYGGSDKMEPCNRLRLKLLVYDNRGCFSRYVNDNLPILDRFVWKWREFMLSIGLNERYIDEETISDKVMNAHGRCNLAIKTGDVGQFNYVEHYIENVSIDEDIEIEED